MKKAVFALFILSSIVLASCGGSNATATLATIPADYAGKTNPLGTDAATAGADVFKKNCESCHGPEGHGDGPAGTALDPKPRNLAVFQSQVGDDYLFWRINTGMDGTSMVAWKGTLTEEQMWQVIAFLHTLKP